MISPCSLSVMPRAVGVYQKAKEIVVAVNGLWGMDWTTMMVIHHHHHHQNHHHNHNHNHRRESTRLFFFVAGG